MSYRPNGRRSHNCFHDEQAAYDHKVDRFQRRPPQNLEVGTWSVRGSAPATSCSAFPYAPIFAARTETRRRRLVALSTTYTAKNAQHAHAHRRLAPYRDRSLQGQRRPSTVACCAFRKHRRPHNTHPCTVGRLKTARHGRHRLPLPFLVALSRDVRQKCPGTFPTAECQGTSGLQ